MALVLFLWDYYYGRKWSLQRGRKPNITFTYIARGIAGYDANDNQGALADFNHAVEIDPNSYLAYYNRGRVKARKHITIEVWLSRA